MVLGAIPGSSNYVESLQRHEITVNLQVVEVLVVAEPLRPHQLVSGLGRKVVSTSLWFFRLRIRSIVGADRFFFRSLLTVLRGRLLIYKKSRLLLLFLLVSVVACLGVDHLRVVRAVISLLHQSSRP